MSATPYRNPARALTAWSTFYRSLGLLEEIEKGHQGHLISRHIGQHLLG